ncbi:MAG: hypothetical protein ABSD98_02680 [Candidatus Korobacteraceae bacterium]|jgi:hypothetical protein
MEPYRHHTFDYYREVGAKNVPPFMSADSLSAPLPSPPPENVWYMASVRFNPYWKGEKAGAAEGEARNFLETHKQSYCAVTLDSAFTPVNVWRFTRCPR